jgi:hypothetical protein
MRQPTTHQMREESFIRKTQGSRNVSVYNFEPLIVIYTISGIKTILQDSSVKIADDEGVSPSSSVITRVSCNML